MKHRVLYVWCGAGLIGCICLLLLVQAMWKAYQELVPPPTVDSLEAFRDFLPKPRAIREITRDGKNYVIILGKQPFLLGSENPAGYIFDETGTLVGWSDEASDIDMYDDYWKLAQREGLEGRECTYDQVLERLRKFRAHPGRLPSMSESHMSPQVVYRIQENGRPAFPWWIFPVGLVGVVASVWVFRLRRKHSLRPLLARACIGGTIVGTSAVVFVVVFSGYQRSRSQYATHCRWFVGGEYSTTEGMITLVSEEPKSGSTDLPPSFKVGESVFEYDIESANEGITRSMLTNTIEAKKVVRLCFRDGVVLRLEAYADKRGQTKARGVKEVGD